MSSSNLAVKQEVSKELVRDLVKVIKKHSSMIPPPPDSSTSVRKQRAKYGHRVHRSDAEIDVLVHRLVAVVKVSAIRGMKFHEICSTMGQKYNDLIYPLRVAVKEGQIEQRGRGRKTRYFAKSK